MNFDLSDFAKYKTYFAKVAEESKHVSGFIFGDQEVGQKETDSWKGLKLWAWPPDRSRMNDLLSDNFTLNRDASIWIGGPCASELHADEDTFYQNCEAVMKKVVSRMIKDKHEGILSVIFAGNTLQRADMRIGATKFIGCEYIFVITDPDGFEYNEDDWIEPEPEPDPEPPTP